MRFKRWPRVEAFQETSRTRAAVALSQRRQRDRLPLLADLIATEQPSIEAVIEERHQAWPKWHQEKRDDRASKWREARRQLAAYPSSRATPFAGSGTRRPIQAIQAKSAIFCCRSNAAGSIPSPGRPGDRALTRSPKGGDFLRYSRSTASGRWTPNSPGWPVAARRQPIAPRNYALSAWSRQAMAADCPRLTLRCRAHGEGGGAGKREKESRTCHAGLGWQGVGSRHARPPLAACAWLRSRAASSAPWPACILRGRGKGDARKMEFASLPRRRKQCTARSSLSKKRRPPKAGI